MRATFAILLGGLMVWIQAAAGLSPHLVEQVVACPCCQCANPACNTQTTVPAPSPSPVVQTPTGQREKTSPPIRPVALSSAPSESPVLRPRIPEPSSLPPLFQRHRILLI